MADFGPSKFEQDIDGGVQNATTALWGDPNAQGRMAYLRARAGLENQQQQDLYQTAASRKAMADILATPGPMGDAARHNLLANSVMAGQVDGAAPIFKSAYGNLQGYTDADRAGGFVGGGGVITPSDAFSQAGQANIIAGQNKQAIDLQDNSAAHAFVQDQYNQQQETGRTAMTIGAEDNRLHTSPEQLAQARILAGKGTPDDYKLMGILHPGSTKGTTVSPDDATKFKYAIESTLGQVYDSKTGAKTAGPDVDEGLKAQITAHAIDLYRNDGSPTAGNFEASVTQAIKDMATVGSVTPPDTRSGIGKIFESAPAPVPTVVPVGAPLQPVTPPMTPPAPPPTGGPGRGQPAGTAQLPQGALKAAPAGMADGTPVFKGATQVGVVKGGYVFPSGQ